MTFNSVGDVAGSRCGALAACAPEEREGSEAKTTRKDLEDVVLNPLGPPALKAVTLKRSVVPAAIGAGSAVTVYLFNEGLFLTSAACTSAYDTPSALALASSPTRMA